MNELTVFNFHDAEVVDSRDVAEMVGKDHAHLLRDISGYIEVMGKNPILDSSNFFIPSTYKQSGNGKENPCYLLTKKGCDMVANKMTGEKGVLFTAAYVTAFEKMREQIAVPSLPKDYPSALRALADAEEKRMALQAKSEADAPKVLFADAVATAQTSILVGELAKLLKQNGVDIGQNRLFEYLRNHGYLICRNGTDYNMPTQKSMDLGLFEIKESVVAHADGHTDTKKTPKVTGKGQQYFVERFLRKKDA